MDATELEHGTQIGRFVITGKLGAGGMGVVYAAHDRQLDRHVALKTMRTQAATDEDRLRMLREGQAMARVTHPNVITVYEVGTHGDMVFLAQELLDGGTLHEWIEARPRAQPEIIEKFIAAGRGLAAAHRAGLVHRDFKPDNVLLGTDGRVRVADFGLARAVAAGTELVTPRLAVSRDAAVAAQDPMSALTRTGAVMGTPMFMAPEQHNGERADARSDQFAFCVALYHALHGAWPFPGQTAVALADAVIHGRMQPPPADRDVPARVRKILLRGLSVDPAARYPSMDALLDELAVAPKRGRRALVGVLGGALLCGGAVIAFYASRPEAPAVVPAMVPADAPVTLVPSPPRAADVKQLGADTGADWLASALERDQLDDASEKYDMAAVLKVQGREPLQASIAYSASAITHALRGELEKAEERIEEADRHQGKEPIAVAYVDLARAAVALGRGELALAGERSQRCARAFATTVPVLATICHELQGDAAASRDDMIVARAAYNTGLGIARNARNTARAAALELALAEVDLAENQAEKAEAAATRIEAEASERGAASTVTRARVLIARARIAQAETQKALDTLESVRAETLQTFRLRIQQQLALGQAQALLGDSDGADLIEQARAEAAKRQFVGLVLEARLAALDVLTATEPEAATAPQTALVKEARGRGFARVARLAETARDR